MNILILASYGIGNMVMKTPMIKALSNAGHDVYLAYDAGPLGGPTSKMLDGWPHIKEMYGFNSYEEANGDSLIRWIHKNKIDLCIQAFPGDSLWDWLYKYVDCEVRYAPKVKEFTKHESEYNLDLVKDLIKDPVIKYDIPRFSAGRWEEIIQNSGGDKIVVLCPGFKKEGEWSKKNWGISNYAELANSLPEDCTIVLIDGADGVQVCNHIKFLAPRVINLAGVTSIQESIGILDMADLVIANDCGPAHLAAALEKRLLVLFGPTDVTKNNPINKNTIVLKIDSGEHKHKCGKGWDGCWCLTKISPSLVLNCINKFIFGGSQVEQNTERANVSV